MSEQPAKPSFDLTLTQEQQLMRDSARKFAKNEMRSIARECDEAGETPASFYEKTVALGFCPAQLPEAIGGYGAPRSVVSNVLLAEDLACGDLSLALAALSGLSYVNTVLDQGAPEQRAGWLADFAQERFVPAAIALMEPAPRFDPRRLATTAARTAGGYRLRGVKTMVPFGPQAQQLLLIAQLEGQGPAAFQLRAGRPGVHFEREAFMGLRPLPLYRMQLDDVEVAAEARLGGDRPLSLQRVLDLSNVGLAALATGVGQGVLDYVKHYCNERVAFGEPITHRQAVAFMIADIAIELDGMRLLTYRAASRADQGLPFTREAYLARLQAADKGMKIGTDGVQLLGGHGFIREHPVELWYRNLRAIGILEGTFCA